MTPVGFEPTQLALVELESTPLDHSGKVSWQPIDRMQPQVQSVKESDLLSRPERGVEHMLHSKMKIINFMNSPLLAISSGDSAVGNA